MKHLKTSTYYKGWIAETLAVLFLVCKGYRVRAWRFVSGVGEVDLIVERGGVLVAVEVKYRRHLRGAFESITPYQQKRIQNAFLVYMAEHRYVGDCRLDVVAVAPWRISHLKNAWLDSSHLA